MSSDWRIRNQNAYLQGQQLHWARYIPVSEVWEHEHCEFCWRKIMNISEPEVDQEAYTTKDNRYWICQQCYSDFKDLFHWTIDE